MARIVLAAVSALFALFIAQHAYAFSGMGKMAGPDGRDMAMKGMPHMDGSCPTPDFLLDNRETLGLSDVQTADLRKLDFQLRRNKLLKGAAVKALELELTEIVTDPGFDVQEALSKLSEIEKARTELRTEVIKTAGRARDLLDAGQKERLGSMLMETGPAMPRKKMKMPGTRPASDEMKDDIKERMMRQMMEENMP